MASSEGRKEGSECEACHMGAGEKGRKRNKGGKIGEVSMSASGLVRRRKKG